MIQQGSKLLLYLFYITVFSCKGDLQLKKEDSKKNHIENFNIVDKEQCDFFHDFNKLRKNILKGEVEDLETYFKFPLENSDAWHLVYLNSEGAEYDSNKDFSKYDFHEYYNNFFPEGFKELLSSVDINSLQEIGIQSSSKISKKDRNDNLIETYFMVSNYSNSDKHLKFTVYISFYEEGEIYETTLLYIFDYNKCQLKFEKLLLAG
ncbi:hypothetical protein GCM10011414_18000 [Croceivirga lutea]|uniref:hypothetical protein n=1 Tax=Croceivirga lutea TaxID=1775167 RepID=UPI00163AFCAC|nr:hypothetical protein [Croceivirga lutea]GGG48639.1 hypothetical protein GCM10011414_18000 [Croceivirga lutea]